MPHISAKPGAVRATGLGGLKPQPTYAKVPTFRRPSTERNPLWRDEAACAGTNSNLFFGFDGERANDKAKREETAVAFCQSACPVMFACRAWAIESGQEAGVWGGMGEDERRAQKRRLARSRPREAS